jgi:hypothetical protein
MCRDCGKLCYNKSGLTQHINAQHPAPSLEPAVIPSPASSESPVASDNGDFGDLQNLLDMNYRVDDGAPDNDAGRDQSARTTHPVIDGMYSLFITERYVY